MKVATFKIGQSDFTYVESDPIFYSIGRKEGDQNNIGCNSCSNAIKKGKFGICTFCTSRSCDNCIKKTKQYPLANANANGDKPRGPICRLCDRKFLLKDLQKVWVKDFKAVNDSTDV